MIEKGMGECRGDRQTRRQQCNRHEGAFHGQSPKSGRPNEFGKMSSS
jgi:hypothetical protein